MNLSPEIKEFLDHAGKVMVWENNEPKFVVSKFRDYMDLVRNAKYNNVTVDDMLSQGQAAPESVKPENSPYQANNHQQQVEDINRELESIAADGFFLQLPTNEKPITSNQPHSFYRELE